MFKSPTTQRILATLSAAGLACAAGPALAGSGQEQTQLTVEKHGGKTLYCLSEAATGSLLPHKTCQSRQDWEASGLKFKSPDSEAAAASQRAKADRSGNDRTAS